MERSKLILNILFISPDNDAWFFSLTGIDLKFNHIVDFVFDRNILSDFQYSTVYRHRAPHM